MHMARVLLAEDDHAVRDFVRRALEMANYQVTVAHDGGEACHLITSGIHTFDLLISDIKMPVMDGITLALTAASEVPDMPILLMTGYADQRERTHGLEAIIAGLLYKPFTLEDITTAAEEALNSRSCSSSVSGLKSA